MGKNRNFAWKNKNKIKQNSDRNIYLQSHFSRCVNFCCYHPRKISLTRPPTKKIHSNHSMLFIFSYIVSFVLKLDFMWKKKQVSASWAISSINIKPSAISCAISKANSFCILTETILIKIETHLRQQLHFR